MPARLKSASLLADLTQRVFLYRSGGLVVNAVEPKGLGVRQIERFSPL
jgi:hypothetical protein